MLTMPHTNDGMTMMTHNEHVLRRSSRVYVFAGFFFFFSGNYCYAGPRAHDQQVPVALHLEALLAIQSRVAILHKGNECPSVWSRAVVNMYIHTCVANAMSYRSWSTYSYLNIMVILMTSGAGSSRWCKRGRRMGQAREPSTVLAQTFGG